MKYIIPFVFILFSTVLQAQEKTALDSLKQKVQLLEDKIEQSELEKLRNEAEEISNQKKEEKSKIFKGGQRSLQALNPEISVAADAFGQYINNDNGFTESKRSGMHFRVAELQVQSTLDPFSKAKVILEFTPDEVEFAEAYLTWNRVFPDVSLTVGKFRQQFGVMNRWHAHSLDQFKFPLPLTTILGDEGLNQLGFSVDWLMPSLIAHSNQLIIQVTNGQNDHLFAGEAFSFPVVLGHLKNYYDLSQDTYLEVGLTGMMGNNNFRGFEEDSLIFESNRNTKLAGLDLTFLWEPADRAKYHSILWRTELYYADKEIFDGKNIEALGWYSYVDYKFDRNWHAGIRYDFTQPFEAENDDKHIYQIVPYITWWQSEWVRLRLQYNYLKGDNVDVEDQTMRLQITWAMGPHKHERY
jgi:hypothetical protein